LFGPAHLCVQVSRSFAELRQIMERVERAESG